MVKDEPRVVPEPEEGIPVSPGDVVQLISTVGGVLGYFAFTPEVEIAHRPGATQVVECPPGQPAVVSVPGNYTDTPIEDMVVTTAPVETALTTGPETTPSVTTTPTGETSAVALGTGPEHATGVTAPGGLQPVIRTDDTVVAAGNLPNSAMGSNEITVTDRNTGEILGETQVDTWRLAGASLNPPVVNKDGQTALRLNIFGPPDLPVTVTATAGEGLTPRQLTATAPLGVLQSQGLGSFTATRSGQHSVSVKASPVVKGGGPAMGLPAWR